LKATSKQPGSTPRAALALLFERVEIVRAPANEPTPKADDPDLDVPLLDVDKWTVALFPRQEWTGDLDGYWQEVVGRVPLTTNEQGSTIADY
jgi:hypothetical protein